MQRTLSLLLALLIPIQASATSASSAITQGLTGSVTAAQMPALTGDVSMSAGTTSTSYNNVVPVTKGGTGLATLTAHSLQVGNGTSSPTQLSVGGNGTVLTGVASSDPAFSRTPVLGLASTATGKLGLAGTTSGTVTIQPQDAAGTYNFNLPTSAGSSGQPLLSGGGGSSAQTYGTLGVGAGGTGLTSGTSGGVPYFSSSSAISSSAALTQYAVVLGGGAGGAPTVVSGLGSSGDVLTSNGAGAAPTFQAAGGGFTAAYLWVSGDNGATTAGNPYIFPTTNVDTASGYNASTGRYTTPGSGTQYWTACVYTRNGTSNNIRNKIYVNASGKMVISDNETNGPGSQDGCGTVQVTGGDIIDIRPTNASTTLGTADNNWTLVRVK